MRKRVMGLLAGALFFTGIIFTASEFTANAGIKALADKPASMKGESDLPARELAGAMAIGLALIMAAASWMRIPGRKSRTSALAAATAANSSHCRLPTP